MRADEGGLQILNLVLGSLTLVAEISDLLLETLGLDAFGLAQKLASSSDPQFLYIRGDPSSDSIDSDTGEDDRCLNSPKLSRLLGVW